MPLLRADLASMPTYVPGRTVPGSIKLASNEVSLPPPAVVLDAVAAASAAAHRYPDLGVVDLIGRLAAHHGVAPDRIAVGCGSVSLCQQLVNVTCREPTDEVLFAWRSFEAYPIVTQVGGATARTVALDSGFAHDLDAMVARIGPQTRLVFVCSPNNPTGTVVTDAQMRRFLADVGPDVLVVLDEAYREFVTDPDAVDGRTLIDAHPNLVVLRTFSKAYRLAGFRVGYALGAPQVIQALCKVCAPFSVSIPAQAAAIAAIDHAPELLADLEPVRQERVRVRDALLAAGFTVPPTQANFVWLALGEHAGPFAAHCMDHKVVVRPFAGDGVRVTVSSAAENDAFLDAARTFRT